MDKFEKMMYNIKVYEIYRDSAKNSDVYYGGKTNE